MTLRCSGFSPTGAERRHSHRARRLRASCAARVPFPRVHDHIARSDTRISPLPPWNARYFTLNHTHVFEKSFDAQSIALDGGHGVDLESQPVGRPR